LNNADRSFIFRCRPGDDGGGVGDRFGGVMGGAFYSLLHGRTFRILWPALEHVFKPGHTNWTFDAVALGIPYLDADGKEIDQTRIRGNVKNGIYPVGDDKLVVVVNDINDARQVSNDSLVSVIEQYKNVYFHSNRGPKEEMYKAISAKYKWATTAPDVESNYAAAYRCVFESMFRPSQEFLASGYKSLGRELVPFSHIVRIVEDPKFTTVAFHHRIDDNAAEINSNSDTVSDEAIKRIVEIAERHKVEGKKANLFFITNSIASARKIMQTESIKQAFHAVYTQELTASIHVNLGVNKGGKSLVSAEEILSTQQAFRDWWVMFMSDILIGGHSGFSKSAALFAPHEQIRYEDEGNAYRPQYWVMCGNRFC
jgi:hypothetical protein